MAPTSSFLAPLPEILTHISDYPCWARGIELVLKASWLTIYIEGPAPTYFETYKAQDAFVQAVIFNRCSKEIQLWLPRGDRTTAKHLWDLLRNVAEAYFEPKKQISFLSSLSLESFGSGYAFAKSFAASSAYWNLDDTFGVGKLARERFMSIVLIHRPEFAEEPGHEGFQLHLIATTGEPFLDWIDDFCTWVGTDGATL